MRRKDGCGGCMSGRVEVKAVGRGRMDGFGGCIRGRMEVNAV